MRVLRVLAVSAALLVLALSSACSGDGDAKPEPLAGEKPGTVRYIVFLEGDAPDLAAYRKARREGKPTEAIEENLRSEARAKARKLRRKLKAVSAKVVETWYLTNAFTVELPENLVPTLADLEGVERIEPDVLYNEAAKASAAKAATEEE
jgi:hypothetical protein